MLEPSVFGNLAIPFMLAAAASNRLREHLMNAGIRVGLADDTLSKEQQ